MYTVVNSFSGISVYCSFVYAKSNYIEFCGLWAVLDSFSHNISSPWLLGDDCNVILYPHESLGSFSPIRLSIDFSDMISTCGLLDLLFLVGLSLGGVVPFPLFGDI